MTLCHKWYGQNHSGCTTCTSLDFSDSVVKWKVEGVALQDISSLINIIKIFWRVWRLFWWPLWVALGALRWNIWTWWDMCTGWLCNESCINSMWLSVWDGGEVANFIDPVGHSFWRTLLWRNAYQFHLDLRLSRSAPTVASYTNHDCFTQTSQSSLNSGSVPNSYIAMAKGPPLCGALPGIKWSLNLMCPLSVFISTVDREGQWRSLFWVLIVC